jgi:PKHD-type hydroxylase
MIWSFESDRVNSWAYLKEAFTPEECQKIIDLYKNKPKEIAKISGKNNEIISDNDIRKNNIFWVEPDKDNEWIYRKLTDCVMAINNSFFNFELYGFTEKLQFTEYIEKNDGYKAHIDKIFNSLVRKLSIVIQLTDPKEYEGCDLQILDSGESQTMIRDQGTVIAFPSYVLHEVKPLISGTRYSLVAWVGGPNFK